GQADDLVGGGRQVGGGQAQRLVQRAGAAAAGAAVVVVPREADGPQQGEGGAAAEAVAARVRRAVGAGHARPAVPPFFRPSRAVCRAAAPRRWTASRTSNSALPKSWASGLAASRRASRRASSRKGCWRAWKRR